MLALLDNNSGLFFHVIGVNAARDPGYVTADLWSVQCFVQMRIKWK